MKKIFNRELLIGALVIVALGILFFGIDYLKGINVFKAANYYYVSYTNVAGLAQSAPVTVNGYKVGLVREIQYEYDNPGHILVELSLDKQLKLPRGTQAVLVTDMLGTSSIELNMATGGNFHDVGDKLVGVNATGLMDNVSGEIMPQVINILPKVDSIMGSVATLVSDPALVSSVGRLDNIMANLETSTALLSSSLRSVAPATAQLPGIAANLKQLTDNLATVSRDLNEVSAKIKTVPIDSTMNHINRITANLDEITTQLNSPNSSLGLLMRDPGLYNNINSTAAHLDSIMIDLKRQPKRYIPSIKVF